MIAVGLVGNYKDKIFCEILNEKNFLELKKFTILTCG